VPEPLACGEQRALDVGTVPCVAQLRLWHALTRSEDAVRGAMRVGQSVH
jgi:hypothetical protein